VSVTDLLRHIGRDMLMREQTNSIAEFNELSDADLFRRAKGRLDYTVCAGINRPWAVRPKSEGEKERDAYWIERSK
jgi:hypothetical protein